MTDLTNDVADMAAGRDIYYRAHVDEEEDDVSVSAPAVLSAALDHDCPEAAVRYYDRLRSLCKPGHFFVEVMPHDCSKNWVSGVSL